MYSIYKTNKKILSNKEVNVLKGFNTSLIMMLGVFITHSAQAGKPPLKNLSNLHFQQCLNGLKHSNKFRGVSGSTFELYRPKRPDATVIQSLNYQPEFNKAVWDYLSILVDQERVADGIQARSQWSDTLGRIESQYGVKAEHVLGVWGIESNFGKTLGEKNLISSLATLSCFDRRQSYFRGEYANALKILQRGDVASYDMKGSWAGAFGQTQFMPSTYRQLAVDFDGDGRRDLVNSVPDALASTANFLLNRGYRTGEPWGYEVKMPAGYWGSSNRKSKKPMDYWRREGFTLADGQPLPYNLKSAGLLLPAGKNGPAFLVGKNFDTFYSYNASEKYALGIAKLATQIEKKDSNNVGFITPWPTDDPGISRKQARELQQSLLDIGYDIGEVDGLVGDATRSAIKQFMQSKGIYSDGRAGQKAYELITGNISPVVNYHESDYQISYHSQNDNNKNYNSSYQIKKINDNQYVSPDNRSILRQSTNSYAERSRGEYAIINGSKSINSIGSNSITGSVQQPNNTYRRVIDANGVVRYVRVDSGND